ncbi:MAG: RluA family pseudouridine synthase [Acutalibacteraceae bacterium]
MNILYEDKNLIVIEKSVGILSEGETPESMPYILNEMTGGRIFPVHRLDRGVGGVMVYAKTQRAAAKLSAQVSERKLKKEYLAVVHGIPEEKSAVLEDLLFKDSKKNKTYVVKRERKGVKKAVLSYETVLCGAYGENDFALVHIKLQTGRSHQIRVQFASRKHPLFGDGKYGAADNEKNIALWSYALEFFHPDTNEILRFTLKPPEESLFGRIEGFA